MNASSKSASSVLATNRKARFHYHIQDTIEAGIELQGTEVKSIKDHLVSIEEAFATIENGQAWLQNAHVQPYSHGNRFNHEPVRPRRLLLHKHEIQRLSGILAQKGLAWVPLDLHLKNGRIKVLLGLGKGKDHGDKRETLKKREAQRDADRAISEARKR